jgi:membrane protein required for colicin V production
LNALPASQVKSFFGLFVMPFAVVDLVVVGLMLISALLATIRGFTREALAIASWVAAAILAYLFYPQLVPLMKQYVSARDPIAIAASAGAIFLVTLIIAYMITARFSDMILDSRIGALDRTLGFIFGAARGFLIAVVGFGFFQFFAGTNGMNHPLVKEARMMPMLESAYASLKGVLPENLDQVLSDIRGTVGAAPDAAPPDQPAQPDANAQPAQPEGTQPAPAPAQ